MKGETVFDSHYRSVLYLLTLFIFPLVPLNGYTEISEATKMSVAVVEFDVKGDLGIKDAGAIIAEWMINAVDKTGRFNLKERVLLKKVLDEQNIGMAGLIKGDTAARIGEIYGVKGLITGSVFKWGNVISITARLIDTNSGSILKTAGLKATEIDSIPNRIDELALIICGNLSEQKETSIEASIEKKITTREENAKSEDKLTGDTDDMVRVKGGCFKMGCSSWAIFCNPDYEPKQKTCVEDFYIDKYETTQKDYTAATGKNPSYFKGENNPVERVKWPDAKKYCEQKGMRLPSEAEWAYAASEGGMNFSWATIESKSTFKKYAWYNKDSKHKSHETGRNGPNSLGIYDIDSNVWEWVGKWQDTKFINKLKYNSNGLGQGRYLFELRMFDLPRSCDSSRRFSRPCNTERYRRSLVIGFRCAK
jgi:formylglycine-generating enzyme required for sulfatase activity